MELAARVYDVVTGPSALTEEVRDLCPEANDDQQRLYWRRVIRLAALCHDIGHLPFSHAAGKDLLPDGWDHERFSRRLIIEKLAAFLVEMTPPVTAEDAGDSLYDGRIRLRMDYSADNAVGGADRLNALADLNMTCGFTVVQYG